MIKFASNFWSYSTKYFSPKCYEMVSATFNFSINVEKIMYKVYFELVVWIWNILNELN